jgi:XTP/dITP diphosphohydrolase
LMQPKKPKLLLASNNQGKIREYKSLLRGIPFALVTPAGLGITAKVEEAGGTFEANASLKAIDMARQSGLLALADDSGLEVDALGGKPGPLSHRFAGAGASDLDRINFLLSKLKDIPAQNRVARFRCVIAVAAPSNLSLQGVLPESEGRRSNLTRSPSVKLFSGECRGVIIDGPKGTHGFGYDPIFYISELGKTMAELTLEEKNKISHRARAAEKARDYLIDIAGKLGT